MKYLFLLSLLVCGQVFCQDRMEFNRILVQCENNWVALPISKDSSHTFGFVYFDAQAGLTFHKEGSFKITSDKKLQVDNIKSYGLKVRLQPSPARVAIIPVSMFQDLNIQKIPKWFESYQTDTISEKYLFDRGFLNNHWNQCQQAIYFLEKLKEKNSNYKGLNVEMSFSYNCLEQFDKAEKVLEAEVKQNPTNAYANKEYIYSLIHNKKIDQACVKFLESTTAIIDKQYNAENCYNIMGYFYYNKDKVNFNKWFKELEKWPIANNLIRTYADQMKQDLDK